MCAQVPPLQRFTLFGLRLTDKVCCLHKTCSILHERASQYAEQQRHFDDKLKIKGYCVQVFICCAGLQLLLSSPRLSAPAGFSGIIAGVLYQLNLFGMKRLKVGSCQIFACYKRGL